MGKIAFVFAGQGAQSVGMGVDLYAYSSRVKELFDMAEAKRGGILPLMRDGPKEQLDITLNTQPTLFLADLACAITLTENQIMAEGVAGFSLGEIPSACFAGVMNESQAFDFVCHRAKVMQECSEQHNGVMFAVLKLSCEKAEEICAGLPEAYPVNYNCPGQTVVACGADTAGLLQKAVVSYGGKAVKLAVSGAFHSPFMDVAGANIEAYLENENFKTPSIPLYANLTAQVYGNPKEMLSGQVNHPVLWQKTIENMIADGFDTFIEVGPGKTLSGLIKKINMNVRVHNVSDVTTLENTVKELCDA